MAWAWTYLAVSMAGGVATLNAIRPARIYVLSLPSFFAGLFTSELPLHQIFWQVLATMGFSFAGAFGYWPGWVGLGVSILSWSALVGIAIAGYRSRFVIEDALEAGMGPGWQAGIAQRRPVQAGGWRRLRDFVFFYWFRHPDVERIGNIDYWGDESYRHRLDVYRPRRRTGAAPVFVFIHGGAWVMGNKWEQGRPLMLHLARRGWICVSTNYRLSPRATFPDHLIDCKRAVAWVKENVEGYGGDPGFVAVGGASAGGHLCSLLALTPGDPDYQPGFEEADTSVAACVPFYGVFDLLSRRGIWAWGLGQFLERLVMKVQLDSGRKVFEQASPIYRVHAQAPPFLIVQGRNDVLVPPAEARRFWRSLGEVSGGPIVYMELPGAQHAFDVFNSFRAGALAQAVGDFLEAVRAGARTASPPA